jgi:MFS family permease
MENCSWCSADASGLSQDCIDGTELRLSSVREAVATFGGGSRLIIGGCHPRDRSRRVVETVVKSQRPLDWLNFFLADVKDGLGPFLPIYLLSSRHWKPGEIGVVMMIAGIATVAARAPFGALIDWTRWKRALIAIAAVTGAVAMSLSPNFWVVAAARAAIGSADAVFPAVVGAISLGIVGPELFTRRVGRNDAFDRAGNAFTAIAAGLAGWLPKPRAVLWLVAALAATSILAVLAIIVDKAGFSAAFAFLAGCALAAFLLLWIAMPETGEKAAPVAERNHAKAPALAD